MADNMTSVIEPDVWKNNVVELVWQISSREYQKEAWFPNEENICSSSEELVDEYLEDIDIQNFLYSGYVKLTSRQIKAGADFTKIIEDYFRKHREFQDDSMVIDDPEWDKMRVEARKFYEALVE